MPPAVTGPAPQADAAQQRAEALRGVLPDFMSQAGQAIVNTIPFVNPTSRAAQQDLGNRLVANVAGLAGATDLSAESFRAADAARADMVAAVEEGRSPAQGGPSAPRRTRGQGTTGGTPTAQTTGSPLTDASLPPLTPEQIRANAAAELSQYNVAELAALQGILPAERAPMSVQDQIAQTAFDYVMRDYAAGTGPNASVEQAASAEQLAFQRLLALMGESALLLPTE